MNRYPYTDMHEMNLDWILLKVKEMIEEWDTTKNAWNELHEFVDTYFENLDVQQEINNKLDEMAAGGELADLMNPYIDQQLPVEVANQIADVVALQIGAVVAAQLPSVLAQQLPSAVAGEAAAWLDDHVDPDTGYVIDNSLSIENAAADAKMAGDLAGINYYSQNKKARIFSVPVTASNNDVIFFKMTEWGGDPANVSVQGYDGESYTTLINTSMASAMNNHWLTATGSYESFLVSVAVGSVPAVNTKMSFYLINLTTEKRLSAQVFNDLYGRYEYRGYLTSGTLRTVTKEGDYLIASGNLGSFTDLPDTSSNLYVNVTGRVSALVIQEVTELNTPYRRFIRYVYSNGANASAWIERAYQRAKKCYLIGDSIALGVLGDLGTKGTSYLEQYFSRAGYEVVNGSVGGLGYVYSAAKSTDEVPWNTGGGRIRAIDVINHYATDIATDADTVVLAFGINDWQTLGDPGVTITESDRRATTENIVTRVKEAISAVITARKNVNLLLVSPLNSSFRGGTATGGYGLTLELDNNNDGLEAMTLQDTYDAIEDACEYYGVPLIDMTHSNAALNYLNINNVLPDKLHPSQQEYNRLADVFHV